MESVDILGGLEDIQQRINDNAYSGELPFQLDLASLIFSARDGHFVFLPDLLDIFIFERTIGSLLSVSLDGDSLPEIYAYSESSQFLNIDIPTNSIEMTLRHLVMAPSVGNHPQSRWWTVSPS